MPVGPQLESVLKQYGLSSLTDWASQAIIKGWSEEQIMVELYKRPEFKTRFPGIFARETANLAPISVDEYLQYEKVAQALGSTWALQLSKQEVDDLISNDVSPQELEERFNIAATAVHQADEETRLELGRLFNISTGNMMRYWMDPKKELGDLQSQYRMGEIAGAALRSGYNNKLTNAQAYRLQQAGLTRDQATQGFGQLATMDELFSPLDFGEQDISQDQQIEFLAGDADVAEQIEGRQARRQAEFKGGGGPAAGEEGFATGEAD
jgi:hypothetical protein